MKDFDQKEMENKKGRDLESLAEVMLGKGEAIMSESIVRTVAQLADVCKWTPVQALAARQLWELSRLNAIRLVRRCMSDISLHDDCHECDCEREFKVEVLKKLQLIIDNKTPYELEINLPEDQA